MTSEAELEARVARGDAQASYELGSLLLTGQRAAVDGPRGIGLVEAAAREGSADATAMLAVFEAMGVGRVQNWDLALDQLQAAAALGSSSAGKQLLLLANPKAMPRDIPADIDWSEVRCAVDLQRLSQPGEKRSLCDAPRMRVIEGFATAAECQWLIDSARVRLQRASVFDRSTGSQTYDNARSNSSAEFQVTDMDLVIEMIRTRISAATRVPVPVFEPMQILHYSPGQEFRPHRDYLDPDNPRFAEQLRHGQRIATFLLYLNEGFEGGETEFPEVGISFRGRMGDAIFWANIDQEGRPDPSTLHAGRPPIDGEKWILSQWLRDRAGPPR